MSLDDLTMKGSLRAAATATPATFATQALPSVARVASVATVAVATAAERNAPTESAQAGAPDSDRWCWPASAAMTAGEIDAFTARCMRFKAKGLPDAEGEALADRLVLRDRDGDHRRSCLECRHLQGAFAWRCGNWRAAGIAMQASDAAVGRDFGLLLQRCSGFI